MKKVLVGLLVPLSLALSGCATLVGPALDAAVSVAKPSAAIGDKVVIEGKRSLILASNAYQAAGAIVVPLIDADKLTREQVQFVADTNRKVADLLRGADTGLSLAERAAAIFNHASALEGLARR